VKPAGLKSGNLSLHRKNEEQKQEIEALEKEISNLKLMSKGEPDLEKEILVKTEKIAALKVELGSESP